MIFRPITFRPFLIHVWVPLTNGTNVTLKGGHGEEEVSGGVGEVGEKEKKDHNNVDLARYNYR